MRTPERVRVRVLPPARLLMERGCFATLGRSSASVASALSDDSTVYAGAESHRVPRAQAAASDASGTTSAFVVEAVPAEPAETASDSTDAPACAADASSATALPATEPDAQPQPQPLVEAHAQPHPQPHAPVVPLAAASAAIVSLDGKHVTVAFIVQRLKSAEQELQVGGAHQAAHRLSALNAGFLMCRARCREQQPVVKRRERERSSRRRGLAVGPWPKSCRFATDETSCSSLFKLTAPTAPPMQYVQDAKAELLACSRDKEALATEKRAWLHTKQWLEADVAVRCRESAPAHATELTRAVRERSA